MSRLLSATRAARRRLHAAEALRVLERTAFAAGLLAAPLLAAHRLLGPLPGAVWLAAAALAAGAASLAIALARPSLRTAALALDGAARLEERVTTALLLADDPAPVARAVVRDAEDALVSAGRVRVPVRLPSPRRLAWPALALLAAALAPPPSGAAEDGPAEAAAERKPLPVAVRRAAGSELKKLSFRLDQLARRRPELEELAAEARRASAEVQRDRTRNDALARISRLEERARGARDRAGERLPASVQRRMEEARARGEGPDARRKAEEALSKLAAAADALAQKLPAPASGTAAEQQGAEQRRAEEEALARALEEFEQSGREAASADAAASELLSEVRDQLARLGAAGEAGRLSPEELERLRRALEQLRDAAGLGRSREELEDELRRLARMKQRLGERRGRCRFCDGELDDDADAAECDGDCYGDGDGECRRHGRGGGLCEACRAGAGTGGGGGPGDGTGGGAGFGPKGEHHPEDPTYRSKVAGKITPGEILSAIRFRAAPGPAELGTPYQQAFESARSEAALALEQEEIPPDRARHVRAYFDAIRPEERDR